MTTQILTRFSRDAWGMSEAEWNRYLQLMRGIRGSVSQSNISPLEVLGIHAATDHERREYARRFAWMMKEDADRVLAFTRAYGEEAGKLNAGTDILDKALLQLNLSAPKARSIIQSGDRLLLFTRIDSCADCDRYLNAAAAAAAQTDTQLDIYVHDAKSDRDIRHWVESHPLDSARIQAKRITFNHHRGELTQLAGPMATIPKLIRLRGDSAVVVDPNRLMD